MEQIHKKHKNLHGILDMDGGWGGASFPLLQALITDISLSGHQTNDALYENNENAGKDASIQYIFSCAPVFPHRS